jgi:hypothetical protein
LLLLFKNKKKSSRRKTTLFKFKIESEIFRLKKNGKTYIAPLNHVPLLCSHPGESAGAGRVGLAGANIQSFLYFTSALLR